MLCLFEFDYNRIVSYHYILEGAQAFLLVKDGLMESMKAMGALRPHVGESRSIIVAYASDLVVETQIINFFPEMLDDLEVLVVLL